MALKAGRLHRRLMEETRKVLQRKEWRTYLRDALDRTLEARRQMMALMIEDVDAFRDSVRQSKQNAVDNLLEMFSMFRERCEERGVRVFLARDGAEACEIVYRIAVEKKAKLLTKSKSMTTEEIGLNHFLEARGLKVVDTDLGEFIIQLAGEKPFHLVYPAVHKTRKEIAELFSSKAGRPVGDDLGELMDFARTYLRGVFLSADVGITGANIAIAETGTVVVETNEGNDRLGSVPPKTHIVVMGLEKLVETVEDALKIIVAHPVSSTGQPLTTYVSFISGRNPLAGAQDGRDLYVVVVDNGRTQMQEDETFRGALHCIRCGACMNICPTYSAVGGYVFGHVYTGPIGIPWTAFVHGLEKAAEFTELCISCGLCKEVCPAKIEMPMMIAEVKHRIVKQAGQLWVNRILENYEKFYAIGSHFPELFNFAVKNKLFRFLLERLAGIEARRTIPPLAKQPLTALTKNRKPEEGRPLAALFADFYATYVRPDLAVKLVDVLEKCGFSVVIPFQKTSGYPYVAYGDLDKARQHADYNVRSLAEYADKGAVIVSIEPTATYCLKQVYPYLLKNTEQSLKVSRSTVSATELLEGLLRQGRIRVERSASGSTAVHVPCHERALDSSKSVLYLLRSAGYEVAVVETGTCCGMAGSFGMKHGVLGYELSNVVGEKLFDLLMKSGCSMVATTSSVCRIHIEEATGLPVRHPLELLHFSA
ncbi:MAG: LUD domain-containing protein [Candidatus Caldarchaeum sp.]